MYLMYYVDEEGKRVYTLKVSENLALSLFFYFLIDVASIARVSIENSPNSLTPPPLRRLDLTDAPFLSTF